MQFYRQGPLFIIDRWEWVHNKPEGLYSNRMQWGSNIWDQIDNLGFFLMEILDLD